MEQAILVYVDLERTPIKVGQLWGRSRNGRESMSFEYEREWLRHPKRFSLDPALKLAVGSFHASQDKPMFGAIDDSAPDRWGRLLTTYVIMHFSIRGFQVGAYHLPMT